MKRRTYAVYVGMAVLILGVFAFRVAPSQLFAKPKPPPANVNWLHYGNDLANTRFQDVDQINPSNVAMLKPTWVFHTGVLDALAELQVSPIVVDGRMFVTDGHDDVFALNAGTGDLIWSYKPFETGDTLAPIEEMTVCCGRNNKGVAYGDGKVFYGRLDDVVVALDAGTGAVVWKAKVADFHNKSAINNAPQFVNGRVIISISGGEFEIRGQVFALDASTGAMMWHFATTDPDSYSGDSYLRGGAAVWNPAAIDAALGLVYLVTGNAAPDILGQHRVGDNLFATSLVALKLENGEPAWHFQEVHHDIWDYDSAQPPLLFGANALGHCSKNGQYYILDRATGTPIFPVTELPVPKGPTFQHAAPTQPYSAVEPLTPLTFVEPNDTGLPAAPQYTPPGEQEFVMVPGDDGGCEWNPAAYSPRTNFIYYGTRYEPTSFKTKPNNTDVIPTPTGALHLGSRFTNKVPGSHPFGLFGATSASTGRIVWKIRVPLPAKSGLTVAGDLVFFGEGNGKFHAAHAVTGAILFTFDPRSSNIPNVGGAAASPVAYVAGGREFVVYAFGGNVPDRNNFTIVDPDSGKIGDAIIAFALPPK